MQYVKYASALLLSCAILSLQGMEEIKRGISQQDDWNAMGLWANATHQALDSLEGKIDTFKTLQDASAYYKCVFSECTKHNDNIIQDDPKLLQRVIERGRNDLLFELLEKKDNGEQKEERLKDLSIIAARLQSVTAVSYLLPHVIHGPWKKNYTILMAAAGDRGNPWTRRVRPARLRVVKIILQYPEGKKSIDVKDDSEETALFKAFALLSLPCIGSDPEKATEERVMRAIVDLLLENGAETESVHALLARGKIPYGRERIQEILKNKCMATQQVNDLGETRNSKDENAN